MYKTCSKIISLDNNINAYTDNNIIYIKGILGCLFLNYNEYINIEINKNNIFLFIKNNKYNKNINIISYIKTIYSLIRNMIIGVTQGFSKKLCLFGIGYKFELLNNNILKLDIGLSHSVNYSIPNNINIILINYNEIVIKGIDKQLVGQVSSDIRSIKKPECYKGKGIRYINEIINIKETNKKK